MSSFLIWLYTVCPRSSDPYSYSILLINGLPAVRRTQPTTKKATISSTTHVQLLQHVKQQRHKYAGGEDGPRPRGGSHRRRYDQACRHIRYVTVCPRSSDPLFIVIYDKKWVTTSWTY